MIKYEVDVYPCGDKYWFLNDKLRREDAEAFLMAQSVDKKSYIIVEE